MKLATQTVGEVEVIEILHRTLDADSSQEFRREVSGLIESGQKVVFDLGQVEFVDSSGLGAILSCLRQLNACGGDLRLCKVSDPVRAMLELVRMHRVVEVHETQADAVGSF